WRKFRGPCAGCRRRKRFSRPLARSVDLNSKIEAYSGVRKTAYNSCGSPLCRGVKSGVSMRLLVAILAFAAAPALASPTYVTAARM
ncbi:MAG TPA: hypothetical protein DEA50_00125, partial [Parvularcula sp.]|nr:hypothetical protein [Parvularcula sp.]